MPLVRVLRYLRDMKPLEAVSRSLIDRGAIPCEHCKLAMVPTVEQLRGVLGTCQRFWDTRHMGLGKCFLRGGFTARTRIHYGNR